MKSLFSFPVLLALVVSVFFGSGSLLAIVISEIHYNTADGDEALEFIELTNELSVAVDLSGWAFVEGIRFTFPSVTMLRRGESLVVAADADALRAHYGIDKVLGNYEGLLDAAGERLTLVNNQGVVETTLRYQDAGKWPVGPDGSGHSLSLIDIHRDTGEPENWAQSLSPGGSPGTLNFPEPRPADFQVVFNELRRGSSAESGWVELFNRGDRPVELGGLELSDGPDGALPYRIAAGTTLESHGFLVLTETETSLGFSTPKVRLFLRDSAGLVIQAAAFSETPPGEEAIGELAEARFPDGGRAGWLTPTPTPGAPNEVPRTTDIVINEIYYHPPEDRPGEFLELFNRGETAVDLSGFRFTKGIELSFEAGTVLPPGGYLVLTEDRETFRNRYEYEGPLLEYQGVLADGGENIRLVDRLGNLVDEVRYYDGGQWSLWADGRGASLELVDPMQDNDFAAAWAASDDSDKADWEQHRFEVPSWVDVGLNEFHMLLVERGIVRIDNVTITGDGFRFSELVNASPTWSYQKGTQAFSDPPDAWLQPGFDDSTWPIGTSGFSAQAGEGVNTVFDDMIGNYTSVAFRTRLELTPEIIEERGDLLVTATYDDGFCVFLNGTFAGGVNCPENPTWDASATGSVLSQAEGTVVVPRELARDGENVLAIIAYNRSLTNRDFAFAPTVSFRLSTSDADGFIGNSSFETDTVPWTLEGTHGHSRRISTDAVSGSSCLEIVATGKGDSLVNRVEVSLDQPLLDGGGYEVSLWTRWIRGSSTLVVHGNFGPGLWFLTREVSLSSNRLAARLKLTVPWKLGTPGEENSALGELRSETGGDNLGPLISEVDQTPTVPTPGTPIRIQARVSDSDGIASVRAEVRRDVEGSSFSSLFLHDDGEHADGLAGDGLYVGELDAIALSGTRVLFYIEAEDESGAVSTFPAEAPDRTCLFQVDREPGVEARLVLDSARAFELETRELHSNDLLDASFVFGDKAIYYNVGLRFRGSPWGREGRRAYRVRFNQDDRLHQRWRDRNLTNRDRDDGAAYYLVGRAGTPDARAPAATYEWVTASLNGQPIDANAPLGFFEPVGREFIERWYGKEAGNDAVVLKGNGRLTLDKVCQTSRTFCWDEASLFHRGDFTENYRFFFYHSMNQSRDNWQPFVDFTAFLDTSITPIEEIESRVHEVFKLGGSLRVLGARLLFGDTDALFLNNGHNGYVFQDPTDQRWGFLPFDMGNAFRAPGNIFAVRDPPLGRLMARPAIRRELVRIYDELSGESWTPEAAGPVVDAMVTDDQAAGTVPGFLRDLRRRLDSLIFEATDATEFRVFTADGEDFVLNAPVVMLEGEAPLSVAQVLVEINGREAIPFELGWKDNISWNGLVTLADPVNAIRLLAFDDAGELVATAEITVSKIDRSFLRGDANTDGRLNLGDPLAVLGHVFRGTTLACEDAADVNDDATLNVADASALLNYLFRRGAAPKAPFPAAGADPTGDELGCFD